MSRLIGKVYDKRSLRALLDTGAAKLPALKRVVTGDRALDDQLEAIRERLEVREGTRGNDGERVVTQRQLIPVAQATEHLQSQKQPGIGEMVFDLGAGLTATMAIKRFEDLIKATKLYQDLQKRLDDPSRFDDLPQTVKDELMRSLTEMAEQRGARITTVEKSINERFTSLVMRINTLTASVGQANSGIRETMYAYATQGMAQAGKITQLEASLGNYYQDGKPGRANLEEQMTVSADRIAGLRAQYTLKVQAGGALAGFGLAASEVDGVPESAFIIAANKFAIVDPATYTSGLSNTPDASHIPFGVDADGIYMNNNVYVKGLMRVDTSGKTLADGLRGSLMVNAGTGTWSDNKARQAIWEELGNSGTASNNNHLVIGDMVTIGTGTSAETRHWTGSSWEIPGVIINGDMMIDGSMSARAIDSNSLTIRDKYGNIVFGSGAGANWWTQMSQLATQDSVAITNSDSSTMVTVNGQKLKTTDFVNALSKINDSNISTFMANAAIGNAYIGNAAVQTLNIAGNSVTVPAGATSGLGSMPICFMLLPEPGRVLVNATVHFLESDDSRPGGGDITGALGVRIRRKDAWGNPKEYGPWCWQHAHHRRWTFMTVSHIFYGVADWNYFDVIFENEATTTANYVPQSGTISAVGVMR